MKLSDEAIRLILGLKIKQLRTEKHLSLADVAKQASVSVSYINEIENGKKYPKPDKLQAIANVLGVHSDELTSPTLNRRLTPVAKLLRSNFLEELPLEWFGIELSRLIEIIANAPSKVNAFIGTLLDISRNYNLTQENFYLAALRSYQEMHENYFPEIEESVDEFVAKFDIETLPPVELSRLEHVLCTEYNYKLDYQHLDTNPELSHLRYVYVQGKPNILYINNRLDSTQRAFIIARQIGFNFMKLKSRPFSSPMLKIEGFEQVINNFRASYFAGALLINKNLLVRDMRQWFRLPTWNAEALLDVMYRYTTSPDMFMQRLSNILTKFFDLKNLFFIHIKQKHDTDHFFITKELHLAQRHTPHATQLHEHYCRRWVIVKVLSEIERQRTDNQYRRAVAMVQRSFFHDTNNDYLVLAIGRTMVSSADTNYCIGIGFTMNETLRKKIAFWNDSNIEHVTVNETCEYCPIADCQERAAPPIRLQRELKLKKEQTALEKMIGK